MKTKADHRLVTDAPADKGSFFSKWEKVIKETPLHHEPASEPQAAPPERIWALWPQPIYRVEPLEFPMTGQAEYVLASTASALAEALRGVATLRRPNGWFCWCIGRSVEEMESNDPHESACNAARTTLARWEGKGEPHE